MFSSTLFKLSTALVIGMLAFVPAHAGSFSGEQKTEIESIVREYLLANPELIREMAQKLEDADKLAEDTQRKKALTENAAAVFKTGHDPVAGNPKGDVTIVEFMDYNCGWCKKSVNEVTQLIGEDKNLKIVFKEFPIFGEHSEYAAKAALAADKQGKYWDLHRALFGHEGQVTRDVTDQLAEKVGLNIDQMKKDMDSKDVLEAIAVNHQLAKALMINGTPAFIVDGTVVPGYLPLSGLQSAVAEVRAAGGCKLC